MEEEQTDPEPFASALDEPRERFLSELIHHALEHGERSADDFVRIIPLDNIFRSLKEHPSIRARILSTCAGLKPRLAEKQAPEEQLALLHIAFAEGVTTASELLSAFRDDERSSLLPKEDLWRFVTESEFWTRDQYTDESEFIRAKSLLATLLERAIVHGLLSAQAIVEPISRKQIATTLTTDELWDAIRAAFDSKEPFSYEQFLTGLPIQTLVERTKLFILWEQIVIPRIVLPHGFVVDASDDAEISDDAEASDEGTSANEVNTPTEETPAGAPNPVTSTPEKEPIAPQPKTAGTATEYRAIFGADDGNGVGDRVSSIITEAEVLIEDPEETVGDDELLEDDDAVDTRVLGLIELLRSEAKLSLTTIGPSASLRSVLIQAVVELKPSQYKPEHFTDESEAGLKLIGNTLIRNLKSTRSTQVSVRVTEMLQELQCVSGVMRNPDPTVRSATGRSKPPPLPPQKP